MGARILVVDDEWSMRELLKNVLELSGFEVLLAKNAKEFNDIAWNTKLDAIILDIVLGDDEDGTQIYDEMVSRKFDKNIPVIFLSALAHDRPPIFPSPDRRYSLVGKPFDTNVLVSELKKALALKKSPV